MNMPYLATSEVAQNEVYEFGGYNDNLVINNNEFRDTKNVCGDSHPVLTNRKQREVIATLTKPNGLFAKKKLCYVDGTSFYYDGTSKGTVADSEKTFVSIGSKICIFPDKKYYDVETDTFGNMIKSWSCPAGTFTLAQTNLSSSLLTEYGNLYTKITATGIGNNFNQYDAVKITTTLDNSYLNAIKDKSYIIQEKSDDYIIITNNFTSTTAASITATAGSVSLTTEIPDLDYVVESDNRLWGCSSAKHEVYASKLGDPLNWNSFENLSTDSYALTIGSDGDFTGAFKHMGYVIFFKENQLHKLYGSKPANYQLTNSNVRGVHKAKSLALVNESLYYATQTGIALYEGAIPSDASADLVWKYKDAVCGSMGNKLYCSLQDKDNNWHLFVYNEAKTVWYREDSTHAMCFTALDGYLYYIDADTKKIMRIDTGTEELVDWYAVFADTDFQMPNGKFIYKVTMNIELDRNAYMDVFIQYDNDETWTYLKTIRSITRKKYIVPVRPHRCDRFKIKISGSGNFKLYSMVQDVKKESSVQ